MRKISIRELGRNPSKELLNLPFEITRHGKVVALVSSPGNVRTTDVATPKEPIKANVRTIKKDIVYTKDKVRIIPEAPVKPPKRRYVPFLGKYVD